MSAPAAVYRPRNPQDSDSLLIGLFMESETSKEFVIARSRRRWCGCSLYGNIPVSISSAVTVYLPTMIRPWRIWPATSSGHPSPKSGCSTWIKRGRSFIHPKTARQQRTSRRWNGWPRCVRTYPNWGEQMVRYYGYYSNVSRGKRQQEGLDDAIPCILEPQGN